MTSIANDPAAALWRTLRGFIEQAFSLFGAPHEIAQVGVRLRKEHALLLMYLRQCETLLRKLFFIEALALAPSLPNEPAASSPQHHARTRRYHEQDLANSETWRVSFSVCGPSTRLRCAKAAQASCIDDRSSITQTSPEPRAARVEACPERRACARRRGKATSSAGRFVSTWPAAERFEALIRAFNDPAPYVKRLARLIRRNAQLPRLFAQAAPRQYGQTVLEEEIRDAALLIRQRRREPDSS